MTMRGAPAQTVASPPAAVGASAAAFPVQQAMYVPPALPPGAWTGAPAYGPHAGMCVPQPQSMVYGQTAGPQGQWRPPGIPGPWPVDEYLFDGGDKGTGVEVLGDWTVIGLDQEDTVAHYDTLDGRLVVEPTNRVPIYAPRFAAVRKVRAITSHKHHDRLAGFEQPKGLSMQEHRGLATTIVQPIEPGRYMGMDTPRRFREQIRGEMVDGAQKLDRVSNKFKPHEDFQIIRHGLFDNSEKARLAARLVAALAWSADQAVQVTINATTANEATNNLALQSVYRYEMPPGKPRLRVVKVASQKQAQPGEEIEFTLRFDNVGDQPVGNVTIVDNLTTRLEYVSDSAQCSVPANFLSQENDGESLVLRWEIADPLDVGKGGIIRFKCRVR